MTKSRAPSGFFDVPNAGDLYQHFKGEFYLVVTCATDEATQASLVIYRDKFGRTFSRLLSSWCEEVCLENSVTWMPRFKLVWKKLA